MFKNLENIKEKSEIRFAKELIAENRLKFIDSILADK